MTTQEIRQRAREIAGCCWDDRELCGSLADQLRAVAKTPSLGSDGDLTDEDRGELMRLADVDESRRIGDSR